MRSYTSRVVLRTLIKGWYVNLRPISKTMLTDSLGFPARDGATHKRRCFEWRAFETNDERETFFKGFGSRWTEFARLEYVDIVRYMIIDPMHCWLQGDANFYPQIHMLSDIR